jgi:endo-1,4-beta-xylanase
MIRNRRAFLWSATAFAAAWVQPWLNHVSLAERSPQSSNTKQTRSDAASASLRDRAAAKGLLYGAAVETRGLQDADFATTLANECSILVPENELKWRAVRPSPSQFNFRGSDRLADFARQNQMKFRGHTLVWHGSIPEWFKQQATRANAEQLLETHISTVVRRYAGKIHSWDVVNEAILPGNDGVNGLRDSLWHQLLGPSYIDIAFRAAAAADPNALLVYNDYGLEIDNADQNARRSETLRLLERLKSQGVPVQALGTQSHLWAGESRFNATKLREFFRDVASLGLKILITELDVVDRNLPRDIAQRDRGVADTYRAFLDAALDEPAVIAVLTWGLSDRRTWLSRARPRRDGASVRPLPFDAQMQPKPAYEAIGAAFDAAPRRG